MTPSITNQITVQSMSPRNIDQNGLVLSADMVYGNTNNADTNIIIETPNLILANESNQNNQNNQNNQSNQSNVDNIVVDILPLREPAVAATAAANLPPLHYDIDDPEGMM
jgi:hypothetical protein